jgi:hypothetical protein
VEKREREREREIVEKGKKVQCGEIKREKEWRKDRRYSVRDSGDRKRERKREKER